MATDPSGPAGNSDPNVSLNEAELDTVAGGVSDITITKRTDSASPSLFGHVVEPQEDAVHLNLAEDLNL